MQIRSLLLALSTMVFCGCAPTPQQLQADWEESLHRAFDTATGGDEAIGEVEQGLSVGFVPITAGVSSYPQGGWGVFGTGNPGPDADGCQRLYRRNDCVRITGSHTLHQSFANELVFPNLIAGDTSYDMELDIDAAAWCASVPATIAHIDIRLTTYSSGGSQGTVNHAAIFAVEPSNYQQIAAPGPTQNGQEQYVYASVNHTATGGAIPKSAVCGTATQRWEFDLAGSTPDFENQSWDSSDWLAIGDVYITAYY